MVVGFLLAIICRPMAITTQYASSSEQPGSLLFFGAGNNKDRSLEDRNNANEDGWTTIQVYTGPKQASVLPLSESSGSEHDTSQPQFYAQARQDELVIALLRNRTGGYFVDLAANDATLLSNTAALEQHYQWQGLCIEPNPMYWLNLTRQRMCQVVGAVVGSSSKSALGDANSESSSRHQQEDQQQQPIYFRYDAGDHGGIAADGFDNGKRWQRHSQLAYTVSLLEIFQRNHVPPVIDYLSLDVEGAESLILLNFPLDQYRIKIITAERLKGEIRVYLKQHGYEFVKRLSHWGESLWVHGDYKAELDMDAVERFSFPIGPPTEAVADAESQTAATQ
jgi:hypothetical protein